MRSLSEVPHRWAGSEGERAMLHAVRARLPEGADTRIEGFVSHVSPAFILSLHLGLLLACGLLGYWMPKAAAALCAIVTLSLLGEATGRFAILRHLFPKAASYNLVLRQPAEEALGAVVLSAPLDVPAWRPTRRRWQRWRPLQPVFAAAFVVLAMLVLRSLSQPWGPVLIELYVLALLVFVGAILVGAILQRRGEGTDSGGGPAALVELARRFRAAPVPGVDVWIAFTGCGHAWQGGMDAFLALHARSLPDPCLVVALDDPTRPPLHAVVSEGPLFAQHHRPTGPALVERLRWAGVHVPAVDRGVATDARAALIRGYRAVAFSGEDGAPSPEAAEQVADVLENLVRWYGEDLVRVADVRPSLRELAEATAPRPRRSREKEALDST